MLAAGVSTLDVPGTRRWADAHALGLARKAPPFARVLGDALSRTGAFPGRGVTQRRQKGSRSVGLSVGPVAVKQQQQQRYPRITTTPWAGSVSPQKSKRPSGGVANQGCFFPAKKACVQKGPAGSVRLLGFGVSWGVLGVLGVLGNS